MPGETLGRVQLRRLATEFGGSILVNEPMEGAVRMRRPDHLGGQACRHFWTIHHCLNRLGFAGTTDQKEDLASGVEDRCRQRQAGRIQLGHEVRDGEPVTALGEGTGLRKEGGRVPVVAHPQQDQIEARNSRDWLKTSRRRRS